MKTTMVAAILAFLTIGELAHATSWGTCYYWDRKHANTVVSQNDSLQELKQLCRTQNGVVIQVCAPYGQSSAGTVFRTYNTYFNWKYLERVNGCSKLSPF